VGVDRRVAAVLAQEGILFGNQVSDLMKKTEKTYVNVIDTVVVGLGFTQPPPGVDMQICMPTTPAIAPQSSFNIGFHDTI
jgi:hypothetical protein